MTGALWAVTAGIGFGIFQTVNRRAVQAMDVYMATFMQLLVSAVVLIFLSAITEDLALLRDASVITWVNFSLAGLFHFFIGWTFLNASQKKIGAARTASLLGTLPLFAAAVALVTLGEFPKPVALVGIVIIVGGVYLVNYSRIRESETISTLQGERGWRTLPFGLSAALCWSISPIFIRYGLAELDSPILGVTVGMVASTLGYGVALAVRTLRSPLPSVPMDALSFKILAGVLVGLSTWARWIALDLTAVATVLALTLVSVPVVNLLSPLLVGRQLERVTIQVWLGSLLIIGGSLVLISTRG
jgi:drug/metabolite transporter (DMT)-like permease